MLNGQIGDAAPCVETSGGHDGICWAYGHAGTAFAAGVFDRVFIDGQWGIGINLAEKKPRTRLFVEKQSVLTNPTKARFFAQRLFQNRSRIGKGAEGEPWCGVGQGQVNLVGELG